MKKFIIKEAWINGQKVNFQDIESLTTIDKSEVRGGYGRQESFKSWGNISEMEGTHNDVFRKG